MRSRLDPASWIFLVGILLPAPSAAQEEDLTLRVRVPAVELTTGSEFTAAVLMDSRIDGVQGWSFGLAHDPALLEIRGAVAGATTSTANAGKKPDFLVINAEPASGSGVTMAAVISFTEPVTLGAGEDYELLVVDYRVLADPTQADPCVPVAAALSFSSELGDPPVTTVVTVLGSTKVPTLVDGTITVRCPGNIEITRCEGDPENAYLEWQFGGNPTWDFLFLYRDGEYLASLDVDATSYTDLGLEPGDYTYTLVTFIVEDPTAPLLVFAYCTATVIPVTVTSVEPPVGYWIGGDAITVKGTAFTAVDTTLLSLFDAETTIPVTVTEVVSETELRAVTPRAPRLGSFGVRVENPHGTGELADAFQYGFIRGEVNSDGTLDISDGIFLLNFLFVGTDDFPQCRDAADTTDDGLMDVSDAIFVFNFLFLGGPQPPPPYPGPGLDPTPGDPFGCLEP